MPLMYLENKNIDIYHRVVQLECSEDKPFIVKNRWFNFHLNVYKIIITFTTIVFLITNSAMPDKYTSTMATILHPSKMQICFKNVWQIIDYCLYNIYVTILNLMSGYYLTICELMKTNREGGVIPNKCHKV